MEMCCFPLRGKLRRKKHEKEEKGRGWCVFVIINFMLGVTIRKKGCIVYYFYYK